MFILKKCDWNHPTVATTINLKTKIITLILFTYFPIEKLMNKVFHLLNIPKQSFIIFSNFTFQTIITNLLLL